MLRIKPSNRRPFRSGEPDPLYDFAFLDAKPVDQGPVSRPDHPSLRRVLDTLRLTDAGFERAAARAEANGSDVATEFLAEGLVREDELAEAIAEALSLPCAAIGADERMVEAASNQPAESGLRHLRTCDGALRGRLYVAPPLETLDRLAASLVAQAPTDGAVIVTTSSAIRDFRKQQSQASRSDQARFALADHRPQWSARSVLTGPQGFAGCLLLCLAAVLVIVWGLQLLTALHVVMSLFFASTTILRLLVLIDHDAGGRPTRRSARTSLAVPSGRVPVYSALVALHHEAGMVDPLVASLAALNWPRSRLDIKLICEADDQATIAAVRRAIADEPGFELVTVPPSLPRTKPKALNHALPLALGEFVVLYDAEDRPDPDQLLEAWRAFQAGDRHLACVQAPLTIRNGASNWFAGLFALEYAVLFRAVLPFLARYGMPLPLGGTSNHFRRRALVDVGSWDSHNVAEDADLGIRLARHGYHTGTIRLPTSEIAPVCWRDWRNQRTRWTKGWMQTWLVHMRNPRQLHQDLGATNFLAFQVLFVGMIAGSVMHTIFAAYVVGAVLRLVMIGVPTLVLDWLLVVDIFNIVIAWLVFSLLARRVLDAREKVVLLHRLWSLWIYWLLVSLAGLRAFYQLLTRPHVWEKTPHTERVRPHRPLPTSSGLVPAE